jgi:hypothetical protein
MAWSDPIHSSFRFPYGWFKRGARVKERLIPSFVHQESWERSKGMRMEAMDEGSLGASFHGGLMES